MKIAQIAPPWFSIPPQDLGGTELVIYNLVEELVAQGHEVTLFATGDGRTSAKQIAFLPRSLTADNVPWTSHFKAYYHLRRSLECVKDFDIVHTHLSSPSDLYLFPLLRSITTPNVTTLHSRFPFDRVESWTGDADKLYIGLAPSIPMVAVSESARGEVPHRLNFVGVVHHGIPMHEYTPLEVERDSFFIWLGRIIPDKGTHLAIEVSKKTGAPLVIAGLVDHRIHESVNYFESAIKPHIDGKQIKYVGPVNMKQKIDLLSRAHGFLNPIQWEEPFGMVLIEAMALGCPVISFARGAASEIIVHQKTGFLVQNVEEMVHSIPLINEVDRLVTRRHIENNFSVQRMAEKYVNIYKKIVAMRK